MSHYIRQDYSFNTLQIFFLLMNYIFICLSIKYNNKKDK